MSLPAHESDLLRQMVRQVLMEIVPQTMAASAASGETVPIASDADLQAFARRIAAAPQAERDAIVSGGVLFRLGAVSASDAAATGAASSSGRSGWAPAAATAAVGEIPSKDAAPAATACPSGTVLRVEKGAVTERHVREAASQGAALVLGPRAVLTPLARDRARASGVEITREK